MDALLFAFRAVSPVIAMVAVGYMLKRIGLLPKDILKPLNRLVFHVFLPVMLFLNVYGIDASSGVSVGYIIYVIIAVLVVFFAMIPLVKLITDQPKRRGALLQSTFRSNYALIGIPLAESLFGEQGALVATLLSAVAIPLFNILAVFGFTLFRRERSKIHAREILSDIARNPLIRGIAIGIIVVLLEKALASFGVAFRLKDIRFVDSTLQSLSKLATPLALLVLGAQFEFSAVPALKKEILFGTLMRTVGVPLVAIGFAYLAFRDYFHGAEFATFVAIFATPVAVSSVPMAQEMGSDVTLAGQLVVWTTLLSGFTVFLASFMLRLLGVF